MEQLYSIDWLINQYENGVPLKYVFFWGHTSRKKEVNKSCFSQWHESSFVVNDTKYLTSEHWMMAQKALLFDDMNMYQKIIAATSPGEAKELGRNVIGFNDDLWRLERYSIVKLGNIHKFNQNRQLGEYLLNTQNRILVEASPVDSIWGIGMANDDKDVENIYSWNGENLLGFVLMEVRDFLKSNGFIDPLADTFAAPWNKYPNVDPGDMYWRMGKGEEYIIDFTKYYDALSEKEKNAYQLYNPTPKDWQGFY